MYSERESWEWRGATSRRFGHQRSIGRRRSGDVVLDALAAQALRRADEGHPVVRIGRARFVDEVLRPALAQPRGYPRLVAICRAWLDYVKRGVFPGGCFFAAASFEFDGRPGVVRDAIETTMNDWIAAIEKAIRIAKEEQHLDPRVDPAQLAFEINSLFFGANFAYNLRKDRRALERAHKAIDDRLEALRVKRARRTPPARSAHPRTARAPRRA